MIYEYKCDKCKLPLEVMKPMTESSREENCPECGDVARRVFSPLPFVWGIGGWDFTNGGMGGRRGDELELRHHQ